MSISGILKPDGMLYVRCLCLGQSRLELQLRDAVSCLVAAYGGGGHRFAPSNLDAILPCRLVSSLPKDKGRKLTQEQVLKTGQQQSLPSRDAQDACRLARLSRRSSAALYKYLSTPHIHSQSLLSFILSALLLSEDRTTQQAPKLHGMGDVFGSMFSFATLHSSSASSKTCK